MNALLDEVTYDDDGLVTAIAQDAATGDVLLFKIEQKGGAACHTGHRSCFYREYTGNGENGELKDTGDTSLTRPRCTDRQGR